jgi:hypothetical protein
MVLHSLFVESVVKTVESENVPRRYNYNFEHNLVLSTANQLIRSLEIKTIVR